VQCATADAICRCKGSGCHLECGAGTASTTCPDGQRCLRPQAACP
jgi:hypothetical protein